MVMMMLSDIYLVSKVEVHTRQADALFLLLLVEVWSPLHEVIQVVLKVCSQYAQTVQFECLLPLQVLELVPQVGSVWCGVRWCDHVLECCGVR